MRSRDGGYDASPGEETLRAPRSGRPSSHIPIRAERSTLNSHALPLDRNEGVRPPGGARSRPLRQRPLNGETLGDRPAPLTVSQRTTNHPEQTIERSKHDSQTQCQYYYHEEASARAPRDQSSRTSQEVEYGSEDPFQSNLSHWTHWYVDVSFCYAISHNVNTMLLQCAPNLLNVPPIHTANANAAVNLTITVLNNFELKRDTIQTKNDFPAQ